LFDLIVESVGGAPMGADMDTSAAPRPGELRAVAGAGYCPIVDMSTFDSWARAAR
jgi:hypothetical protein